MVDKETFSYWVTHPGDLTAADYRQLQESVGEYPYCQALHTLAVKAASVHQKGQAVGVLRQAAAQALSRNALRKLIDNEFEWSVNLLTKLNELSQRHVPIPDDYQQETYALFKSKPSLDWPTLSDGFPHLTLLRLPTLDKTDSIPPVDDPTLTEKQLQDKLTLPTEPTPVHLPQAVDPNRLQEQAIIEQFIQQQPNISRIRLNQQDTAPQEDLAKRSVVKTGGIDTESFAKILVKQGKVDKAIAIYQKLMVKNPEKKAYFAALISDLTGN